MNQYEQDIAGKYDNVGAMKEQGELKCRQLEIRKKALEARVSALKQQISFLKIGYEAKRQQLAEDETAANLDAQKESETDFRVEKGACHDLASQINKVLQDSILK